MNDMTNLRTSGSNEKQKADIPSRTNCERQRQRRGGAQSTTRCFRRREADTRRTVSAKRINRPLPGAAFLAGASGIAASPPASSFRVARVPSALSAPFRRLTGIVFNAAALSHAMRSL